MYSSAATLISSFSKTILVQLSNDSSRATEVDEQIINQAIEIASERIDAALRSRYQLPLSEPCTMLETYALNLARHWLYSRRPEMKLPETIKENYNTTIKELDQIANGRLHLGLKQIQGDDDLTPDVSEFKVKANKRINTDGY
ncbi:gp436 family protein [Phocoenobacter skyensis]|uniref:DUF1320 domain-containing protein n=1 Tax=Phocoenobacter skyensis TaxID=97481 RepID=A0ABT9JPM6_9PAST|nr:DUF1320 domain-containing protein [Pasteurella skyensis]MDP8080243.1 DUF1320 domain-containing protein [Pasteurella skyensis]MDP8086218.1 DUF1320 domain-containing protein [Pasteurella skyensis]